MSAVRSLGNTRKAPESLSVEIVEVTPDIARKWLTTNTANRNLKRAKIDTFARQLVDDEWLLTGQTIQFDTTGRLIDGQHRCHAVIDADRPVRMLIAKGVAPAAQAIIDTGTSRNYADVLTMTGTENASSVAALAKRLVLHDLGTLASSGRYIPANYEMADALQRHPGAYQSASVGRHVARGVLTPAVAGMWHCVLSEISPDTAAEFFTSLRDGIGLQPGSPILALRNRVDRDRMASIRVSEIEQGALLVYAWNAYRQRRPLTKIQLPKGGVNSGNFPVPV